MKQAVEGLPRKLELDRVALRPEGQHNDREAHRLSVVVDAKRVGIARSAAADQEVAAFPSPNRLKEPRRRCRCCDQLSAQILAQGAAGSGAPRVFRRMAESSMSSPASRCKRKRGTAAMTYSLADGPPNVAHEPRLPFVWDLIFNLARTRRGGLQNDVAGGHGGSGWADVVPVRAWWGVNCGAVLIRWRHDAVLLEHRWRRREVVGR